MSEFGTLRLIDAGALNVGYAEVSPTDGPAVVLLHGWPYYIHSYVVPIFFCDRTRSCGL